MDRENVIETLLLSRCSNFHNNGEILKLLEERYSVGGSQKNFFVLQSTDGGISRSEIKKRKNKKKSSKSLFGSLNSQRASNTNTNNSLQNNKHNPLKTRNEFKSFIKTNLQYQDNLIKKLKTIRKKNPKLLKETKDITQLKICSNLLKFEDFIEINRLWNNYTSELIGASLNINNISSKLSSCEFIGALIKVSHSECIDNIGITGIVIWESQFNYVIVVPRSNSWKTDIDTLTAENYSLRDIIGGLKLINKKNTRFSISVPIPNKDGQEDDNTLEFEIIGNRMAVRSVDRANKKFKSHSVKDIKF